MSAILFPADIFGQISAWFLSLGSKQSFHVFVAISCALVFEIREVNINEFENK